MLKPMLERSFMLFLHRAPLGFAVFTAVFILCAAGVSAQGVRDATAHVRDIAGGKDKGDPHGYDEAPASENELPFADEADEALPSADINSDAPMPEGDPDDLMMQRFRQLQPSSSVLTKKSYVYDPQDRRDPFLSPYEQIGGTTGPENTCTGVSCMGVQEIEVIGVMMMPDRSKRVIVMGPDKRGYWLPEGAQLKDGFVLSIDIEIGEVIFRQDIDDPLSIKPFRDISRLLNPAQEGA